MLVILQIDLENWRLKVTCTGCHSLLEIDYTDVETLRSYSHSGYQITCPVDNHRVMLSSDDLPYLVTSDADRRWREQENVRMERLNQSEHPRS